MGYSRIRCPAGDHTWTVSFSGFAGEVHILTYAWGIYDMNSVTLHVSLIWHLNTLDQGLAGNWQECNFLSHKTSLYSELALFPRPSITRDHVPSSQRGHPKDFSLKYLTTWLREDHKGDPNSLTYNCGYHKQSGTDPSHNTANQHPKRQRARAFNQWKIHLKYSSFILG